jgi:putative endonuclease
MRTVGSNPTLSAMYYAYILRSLRDGTYYYGSASDLQERLRAHNSGRMRYTKGHIPYRMHYYEEFKTRSEAVRRERYFKSIAGYRWLKEQGII